jgi:hypothetical protein
VSDVELPGVVRRMADRINSEPRPRASKLWTAAYLLMGLRYSDELVSQLLEGIQSMRESTTYQAILREGRIAGEQQLLLRLATKRFGAPDVATVSAVEAIQDVARLEQLGERILDPTLRGWQELLGGS